MESTIAIPCSSNLQVMDKEKVIELNEELIEYLCNFTSSYKYSRQEEQFKKNLKEKMSLIKGLHKGKFMEVMSVMKCLLCKNREISHIISCNHGFCQECIKNHINQKTMNNIILNENESKTADHISTNCPVCSQYLTEEDLKSVFNDITPYKDKAKMRKIMADIENEKKFVCFSCGKTRGDKQFMGRTCGHMCKTCFALRGCKNLIGNCEHCKSAINENDCDNIKINCFKCQKTFYVIGDFMQEVCINFMYCCECADYVVEHGICECHKKPIPFTKKREIVQSIIRECNVCNREQIITSFLRNSCCSYSMCFNCSNTLLNCTGCNKPFSQRLIKSIQSFFKS